MLLEKATRLVLEPEFQAQVSAERNVFIVYLSLFLRDIYNFRVFISLNVICYIFLGASMLIQA